MDIVSNFYRNGKPLLYAPAHAKVQLLKQYGSVWIVAYEGKKFSVHESKLHTNGPGTTAPYTTAAAADAVAVSAYKELRTEDRANVGGGDTVHQATLFGW